MKKAPANKVKGIANCKLSIGSRRHGLMLTLYPVASELKMHDVCDSIDLRIWHNRTPEVIEQLNCAAASETDPDLKRHMDGLHHIT